MPAAVQAGKLSRGAPVGAPRRLSLLLLAVLGVLFLPARPASAHAVLLDVSPDDGARVAAVPEFVELTFNEFVGLGERGIRIFDPSGSRLDTDGDETVDGTVVRQPLAPSASGWLVVSYQVVSGDGHVIEGAWSFAAGEIVGETTAPPTDVAEMVGGFSADPSWPWLRALANVFLLAGVGSAFALVLFAAAAASVRLFAAGSLTSAGVFAVLAAVSGDGLVWSGRPGLSLLGRAVVPVCAAVLLLLARGRRASLVTAFLVALPLASFGLTGHGFTHGSPLVNWLLLTTHLVLAAAWVGAAPAMLLFMRSRPSSEVSEAHRRFSRVATTALPLLAASAGLLAWILTEGSLVGSYGRVLLFKSGLVGACALAGLWARRRLDTSPERLRPVFLLEALAVVALAGVSAQLSHVGPDASGHQGHEQHHEHAVVEETMQDGAVAGAPVSCMVELGARSVDLSFDTSVHGDNAVHVTALGSTLTEVTVVLEHPLLEGAALETAVPLVGAGHASSPLVVPLAGSWTVTVKDNVDRFTVETASCELLFT
jgi:copper transport protein